jgi:hypothetical protein
MEAIKPEIDHRKTDVGTKRIGLNRADPQGLTLMTGATDKPRTIGRWRNQFN